MSGTLTIAGAFLLGLISSGHCLVMCGGISGALALATRSGASGRPSLGLLIGYQIGRISSYAMAGLALAGIGASLVHFVDRDQVRIALRWITALLFVLIGLNLLARGRGFDLGLGRRVWARIAPLARELLPVRHFPQALALGALWGWMPCGLVYSVLFVAWLSLDPWRSAAIMLMFGLGTMPAVLAGALGAGASLRFLSHAGLRRSVAIAFLIFGALTAAGPWLAAHTGMHAMH